MMEGVLASPYIHWKAGLQVSLGRRVLAVRR
jgi:hypothetical protein